MRRFLITVNGRRYEVEVEEVSSFAAAVAQAPQPVPGFMKAAAVPAPEVPTPATTPVAAPVQAAPSATPSAGNAVADGKKVLAPMPGKIVCVKAVVGQAVKRGDVLMLLEAMKMENEIQAPADGTVAVVAVSQGASVGAGDLLASIL